MTAPIVIATLNARYHHTSFGLRYLLANMGDLSARTRMMEFDIAQRPIDIAEAILAQRPRMIGLGVYVWNAAPTTELVALLRRAAPEIVLVLGGPEVSFESGEQPLCGLADFVLTGEADLTFPRLCREVLDAGRVAVMRPELIASPPVDPADLALPYDLYTADDIAHRTLYVEASRGCPFTCDFCLSSLEVPVRRFDLNRLLPALQRLIDRGARQFKFVDRTFNLDPAFGAAIMDFFLARMTPGLFMHVEMVPDRLPDSLKERIAAFPRGSLQLEVGIQTFNGDVAARIHRRQDFRRTEENLRYLRDRTGAHLHADLIAGLPGEPLESFATGFDRLLDMNPHEIQVGILKRLRGAPIAMHDAAWGMTYSPHPPYEVVRTGAIDFLTMQRIRRFARYWDLLGNSGNFRDTLPLFWRDGGSPCTAVMRFADWMHERHQRTHVLGLEFLSSEVFNFLTGPQGLAPGDVATVLLNDYQRGASRDIPTFLRPHVDSSLPRRVVHGPHDGPRRQALHRADCMARSKLASRLIRRPLLPRVRF